MTTGGEGGMLVTAMGNLKPAWTYKDHGKADEAVHDRDTRRASAGCTSVWNELADDGMQPAIGRVELRKLEDWVSDRRRHAEVYRQALSGHAAIRVATPSSQISLILQVLRIRGPRTFAPRLESRSARARNLSPGSTLFKRILQRNLFGRRIPR